MPAVRRSRKPAAPARRPYLSRERRRLRLLELAAGIVERGGWDALSISALAAEGGISRQLIYQHFDSQEALLGQVAWHIFESTIAGTRASIAAHPESLAEAVRAAEAVTLDLPPGRGDALWQLIAGTVSPTPELQNVRRGLRRVVTDAWTPIVCRELGFHKADGAAYAWMTVMAFWGMRQLVREGEITRARGVRLFGELVQRIVRA